jgi:hypothetical protein
MSNDVEGVAGVHLATEADVDRAKQISGRSCGDCSLCCRLLDVPEAGKQTAQWCPHCKPGKGGCSIYADRPQACRRWACLWLLDPEFGDEWFPKKCGMVVDTHLHESGPVVRVQVDPRTPDVWRREPFFAQIKRAALRGLRGDAGMQFATIVAVGHRPWLLVLPHRETEWGPGITFPIGPDQYEFLRLDSDEAVMALDAKLRAMTEILKETREQCPDLAPMSVLARAEPRLSELFKPTAVLEAQP